MNARAAFFLACLLPASASAVPLPEPRPSALVQSEESDLDAVPLPEPRPDVIETPADWGPNPPPPGLVEAEIPLDPLPDPACDELEISGEAEFERLDRIAEGQCGALTPIRLTALTPKEGGRVTLENSVTVTCAIARQALIWLAASVQPAAQKHLGAPITVLRQTGGYECRGRNRVAGAKLSEHGRANALDIGAFERADGKVIKVSDQGEAELGFLNEIRMGACGPFTTVLGPGVASHDEHFHFDLAKRAPSGRYSTYCR